MGIALYKRPGDGAIFAIVSRKSGPSGSYLWQYRLEVRNGALTAAKVRQFGRFSGAKEIEAIAVDHRVNQSFNLPGLMAGEMDEVVESLIAQDRAQRLAAL